MFGDPLQFFIHADWYRFEKSLYDLIRGLRSHKGTEREYIQSSIRECRAEIRGADMGVFRHCILGQKEGSFTVRPEGYGAAKADIPGDVWARHVLGFVQRSRGHVLAQIHPEACRISWSNAKLPARHGSLDVSYEPVKKGEYCATPEQGMNKKNLMIDPRISARRFLLQFHYHL